MSGHLRREHGPRHQKDGCGGNGEERRNGHRHGKRHGRDALVRVLSHIVGADQAELHSDRAEIERPPQTEHARHEDSGGRRVPHAAADTVDRHAAEVVGHSQHGALRRGLTRGFGVVRVVVQGLEHAGCVRFGIAHRLKRGGLPGAVGVGAQQRLQLSQHLIALRCAELRQMRAHLGDVCVYGANLTHSPHLQ